MIIELAVPELPVAIETSFYHQKNLESIFSMGIVEHLEITDNEVREVRFRGTTIRIILSEPERKLNNDEFHLERTTKVLVDWLRRGGDTLFDLFDFTLPPIKSVKQVYPV